MKKEYTKLQLAEIVPYDRNPRKNDDAVDSVKKSIEQCGYIAPIIVDENNIILAGHTRYKALNEMDVDAVDVVVVSGLTDEQKRKYRLLDNKTSEMADWDFDLLAGELEGLDFGDLDIDWGIKDEPDEAIEDDFDEELPVEPMSKLGDIYQLGRHRVMCGDSTKIEDVQKLMRGGRSDICITSPPYGMGDTAHLRKHLVKGQTAKDGKTFYGDNADDKGDWPALMTNFFKCTQAVTYSQFVNVEMVADNKKSLVRFVNDNLDNLVDVIVWNKHTVPPQAQSNVLNNGYEFVFIFDNDNSSRTIRFGNFKGTKSNYLETSRENNQYSDVHKAVYSVEFVSKLLDINSLAKSVYDPFGGTGTTLIACEQQDCDCYMMELEPKYVDIIIARWEEFTGETAVKLT